MPVNWQDKAVQDRLLVAIIASVDNKISPAEIARLYGTDMTYNAVESYLRKFRKEAKEMMTQATGRVSAAPSPARPKNAKSVSPIKAGVKTGRVTKNKAPVKVKKEIQDNLDDDDNDDDVPATNGNVDDGEDHEMGTEV